MTLTDNGIIVRRTRYACCALSFLNEYVKAKRYGDTECAEKNRRYWLYMLWAKSVMDDTPLSTETDKCGTVAFGQAVALKADCICSPYGCISETTTTYPPTDPCTLVVTGEVIAAVDVNQRVTIEGDGPSVGDSYIVVSGASDGTWSTNTIQTWNGSGWDGAAVPFDEIIATEDVPAEYWITPTGTTVPGLLFPTVTITWDGITGSYQLESDYPQISAVLGRQARVEILTTGGWISILVTPESTLVTPQTFSVGGFGLLSVRVTYTDGACSYVSAEGTIDPPIGCGTLVASGVATALCNTNEFTVDLTITSAVGFLLGDIEYTVDGILQVPIPATIGTTVLGPFDYTEQVDVTVTNDREFECNVFIDNFTDPAYPFADTVVLRAVDASFQPSAIPGEAYLIVSDNSGSGNTWAANVGNIWTGSVFVTPADGEIIRASAVTGFTAFWQRSGSSTIQIYSGYNITYNASLDAWYAVPTPVAPFAASLDVSVEYTCSGLPTVIYSGPASGFTSPIEFFPSCDADEVSGSMTYDSGGCVYETIPRIAVTTVPGDPDPDFLDVNINTTVLEARVQSDRGIVVCGLFTLYGAIPARRLTRLNSDGSLDTAFNLNVTPNATGGFDNRVDRIELTPAGKIYCGGYFKNLNGVTVNGICRLNADGTLDTSFATGTGFNGHFLSDILLRADGTLICIGDFTSYNGTAVNRIVSLNPDGTIDSSFNVGTGLNNYANRLSIDNSGNILVATSIGSVYNGNAVKTGTGSAFRIQPNGTFLDVMVTGTQFNGVVLDMTVQPDDKIIFVGSFTDVDGTTVGEIIRLNSDLTEDIAFITNTGTGANGLLYDTALMPNGQMVIGCFAAATSFNGVATGLLFRLNADGTRDLTFNSGTGFNSTVYDTAIDSFDGSLVSVGNFTTVDGLPRVRVVRLL